MNFSLSSFRAAFPEFGNTTIYPDAMIEIWVAVATQMVQECRWKGMWQMGVSLYVAHEITIQANNAKVASNGGTPGQNPGIPTSKAVGGVNASYDSQSTSEKNAAWWNLTTYGKQFIRFARIFGAGAIQL